MSIEKVNTYLTSGVKTPFFYFVGDSRYQDAKEKLAEMGFSIIRVSDYCQNNDKLPDIDRLFDQLTTSDEHTNENKMAVIAWRVPCASWKQRGNKCLISIKRFKVWNRKGRFTLTWNKRTS